VDSTALRLLAVGALLLVVACPAPQMPCKTDTECGSNGICNTELGQCVAKADFCSPACPGYEECVANKCERRYSAVVIREPTGNAVLDGGTQVSAELVAIAGRTRNDPAALQLAVTYDGGVTTQAIPGANGTYSAAFNPTAEGLYQLQVNYADAGLASQKISVTFDRTPPTFVVLVPEPTREDGGSSLNNRDPMMANAWRRDEIASIRVLSTASDVAPNSVQLVVTGVGDGGTPGIVEAPIVLTQQTTGCDAGYCGTYELPLWQPQLKAFRGQYGLVVVGADLAGNRGGTDGGIGVTRWKWDYNANAGAIVASPAIGASGTIYVGTSGSTSGQFFAVTPQGVLAWSRSTTSPIVVSPAVGTASSIGEIVYYGTTGATGTLAAVNGLDGGQVELCSAVGDIQGGITLETTAATRTVESAVAILNPGAASQKRIVALRPDGGVFGGIPETCIASQFGVPTIASSSAVVSNNGNFYYGDVQARLQAYVFSGGGWIQKSGGWPVNLFPYVSTSPTLVNSKIVGGTAAAGVGELYSINESTAQIDWRLPLSTDAWSPSVDTSNRVFVGTGDGLVNVVPIGGDAGTVLSKQASDVVRGAPVLGQGDFAYTADSSGVVQAWKAGMLSLEWGLNSPNLGSVQASVSLDCSRDSIGNAVPGRPGVLYVASTNGHLFAFIVDSRGIDTSAPWPKYQHDPRNTGNAQTPLSQFACP